MSETLELYAAVNKARVFRVLTTRGDSETVSRTEFEELREAIMLLCFDDFVEEGRHLTPLNRRKCPLCGEPLIRLEYEEVGKWCCETCRSFPDID